MRYSGKRLRQAGLISVFACVCMAQNRQGAAVPQMAVSSGKVGYMSMGPGLIAVTPFQPVTGAPYSAEEVTEHVQTLADGTNIRQTNGRSKIYRDSEGRTRTEHTLSRPGGNGQALVATYVTISDPVAGFRYLVNERSHTASRIAWPPAAVTRSFTKTAQGTGANRSTSRTGAFAGIIPPPPPPPSSSLSRSSSANARPHPEMKTESLGTQTIEGVSATGTRTTTTFPEGFFGNDRPIVTTSETWISPELKRVVLMKSSDPRYGETTMRLTNIVRAEPDPSLFQIPEDYKISDGPEGINFDPPAGKQ